MKILVTCSGVAALLGFPVLGLAQLPSQQTAQPPVPSQRTIEVPKDLPPPVGEDMRVNADDLDTLLADGRVVFLDVREPWELKEYGTREGYINIPISQLEKRLSELPKDKAILTA